VALPLSGASFRFERRHAGRRRNAVEGYVNERCHAPGGRRTCRGREALPFGAPWLVDVDVGVDESRQNRRVAGIIERA
jgi:hypothetical protein